MAFSSPESREKAKGLTFCMGVIVGKEKKRNYGDEVSS